MQLFRRSKKYYYIKYENDSGEEIRLSTRKKRKDEALKVLSEFKEQLENGRNQIYSFGICMKDYLAYCKINHSEKYYNNMKSTLEKFLEQIGNRRISAIKRISVTTFIDKKIIANKPFQANQHFRNLRTFFNFALDNEYITQSPMLRLKPPKLPEKKPLWITEKELTMILDQEESEQLKDIYQILFFTGMRANELLTLTWQNIDLDKKLIFIRNSESFTTKTGKERVLPINNKAFQIINRQPSRFKGRLLFAKNGVKINVDYVSKRFKKALRDTELDGSIHLHSLRHSYASNLINKDESIYNVSKLLGHARVSTTERYAHVKLDQLRQATDRL